MQGDSALGRVLALVRDLRKRSPWNGAQTANTLRPYLVEEVLELDHAIASGDPLQLREELGDMLLHLSFQIVLAEERSMMDAEAVVRALEQKMRRRHAHLMGDGTIPVESWERSKRRDSGSSGRSAFAGVPPHLPPLLMALRLQERAAGVGFDWPDEQGPLAKVREEMAELEEAAESRVAARVQVEIGDLFFAAVNLSRKFGVDPNQALEVANQKFRQRFEEVERMARDRGVEVGQATLDELDTLWEEVKQERG
ncbi:MAG: nucleoside triphosphate pyrophosphohydrolase [Gemmatimonadales bacterium]